MKTTIVYIAFFALLLIPFRSTEAKEEILENTFTTTAYYSPEPGQSFYYKGSYDSELMLNGLGKVTASGSSIYEGSIAVPKNIKFGTIIEIYNKGFFVAEDRGSAIIDNGSNPRIDIWKGFGEKSLREALDWGIKNVHGYVYPFKISEFDTYIFDNNLEIGSQGHDVEMLQKQLKQMGFYDYAVTGFYGEITSDSVYRYQVFKGILNDRNFPGAGRVGPGTRRRLNFMNLSIIKLRENKIEANRKNPPAEHYKDLHNDLFDSTLAYGDTAYSVYTLQMYLKRLGLFNWDRYTYQYLDATKQAVLNFQLKYGVIESATDHGAGVFGPSTRNKLKEVLNI